MEWIILDPATVNLVKQFRVWQKVMGNPYIQRISLA